MLTFWCRVRRGRDLRDICMNRPNKLRMARLPLVCRCYRRTEPDASHSPETNKHTRTFNFSCFSPTGTFGGHLKQELWSKCRPGCVFVFSPPTKVQVSEVKELWGGAAVKIISVEFIKNDIWILILASSDYKSMLENQSNYFGYTLLLWKKFKRKLTFNGI